MNPNAVKIFGDLCAKRAASDPEKRSTIASLLRVDSKRKGKFEVVDGGNYRLSLTRRLSSSDRDSITLATTLDLSRGGMRIHTEMPLVGDALMQFCFDHSFPAEVPEGVGHVAWCHKEIDQARYQAGIAFQGNHIVEAIDAYLKEQQ